jgi:hypothetical protein
VNHPLPATSRRRNLPALENATREPTSREGIRTPAGPRRTEIMSPNPARLLLRLTSFLLLVPNLVGELKRRQRFAFPALAQSCVPQTPGFRPDFWQRVT